MNRRVSNLFLLGLVGLCCLTLWSCGESRTPFVGTYKSTEPVAEKGFIELTLRDNGEADWKWLDAGSSTRFKWRVQDGRVWLYTKEGVIIIATPANGAKHLSVNISGEWDEGCPVEKCINFSRHN